MFRGENLNDKYKVEELRQMKHNCMYLIGKVIKESIWQPNQQLKNQFLDYLKTINDKQGGVTAIISTNYDILLDDLLLKRWGYSNYGIKLRAAISQHNREFPGKACQQLLSYPISGDLAYIQSQNPMPINNGYYCLLKIHGSLNWLYCPKCREIDITMAEKGGVDQMGREEKLMCLNPYCTEMYEPLIVTPTMYKIYDNPFISKSWALAEAAIAGSSELIFIGYSLQEADFHLRSMLIKAKNRTGFAYSSH